MSVSLSFPDSTYSESNKPAAGTLKSDLQAIETDHNAHLADTTIHFLASTMWPIGSVYTSVVSTNPATLLGFGTWTAFAAGRTLVGLDAGQTEFDTVEETGGAKTHTLTASELPTTVPQWYGTRYDSGGTSLGDTPDKNVGFKPLGSGSAHNNLQPYIVVYFWKRTA